MKKFVFVICSKCVWKALGLILVRETVKQRNGTCPVVYQDYYSQLREYGLGT